MNKRQHCHDDTRSAADIPCVDATPLSFFFLRFSLGYLSEQLLRSVAWAVFSILPFSPLLQWHSRNSLTVIGTVSEIPLG